MGEQREGNPASVEVQKPSLEHEIQESEQALGLRTEQDRLIESSLFIDKKFLSYALITGVTQKPERIFGNEAWADYLDGRQFTREYGSQDLTPDFILSLHKKLTSRSAPDVSGKIRDVGVIGSSYDDGQKPVTYTPEQVRALEENPQLGFRREPPDDPESTTGFIVYPHGKGGEQTQEGIKKDLEELCEWFNDAKGKDMYNPHIVAALLQHRLISLHPFRDSNGRLSRTLMNWSLENDGEAPSAMDDPSEDILTDEETWISYISEGSKKHTESKKKAKDLQEAGIDSATALFDLGQDKAFYEYIFKHFKEAPPLPTNGDKHNHQKYEEFLAGFKEEMNRFQEYMQSSSTLEGGDGKQMEVSQGGLITPEFMKFASSSEAQVLPLELRRQLLSDVEVYRGGMVQGDVDDTKVLQMLQEYTGVGTGYRSLQRSHLSPTSLHEIHPSVIRESMEYYNKMFASSYFKKKHPEMPNPYPEASVRDLDKTIKEHTAGGESIWNSPFASTSLDYSQSVGWARRFSATYAADSNHGILFKAQAPKEGTVLTFGKQFEGLTAKGIQDEYEALVIGGLQPASITVIEVYDRGLTHGNPGLSVKRLDLDGRTSVVVEDRRGDVVVRRTYDYDPSASKFQLATEETTDIPSSTPIERPPAFDPYHYKDFTGFKDFGGFTKEYDSPFMELEKYSKLSKHSFDEFGEKKKDFYDILNYHDELEEKIFNSYTKKLQHEPTFYEIKKELHSDLILKDKYEEKESKKHLYDDIFSFGKGKKKKWD